jgi:ubiquitin-conjugating enzyme E2 variant
MLEDSAVPPVHYELTRSQFLFSVVSIIAAFLFLAALALRLVLRIDLLTWWLPVAFVAGVAAADLGSGLVHWAADTWGRDDLPIIGRRLLVPFRVHHVNPDDFLRRSFVDTNGDVAFMAGVVLATFLPAPLETPLERAVVVSAFAFCGFGMLTNQIHQWAHNPSPPALVRVLQRSRLILGPAAHAEHHARPFDDHYCITTGWWNRPLARLSVFRRLESAITFITGARPREDDRRYERRFG